MHQPTGHNKTLPAFIHIVCILLLMHCVQTPAAQKESILGKRKASQAALFLLEEHQRETPPSSKRMKRQDPAITRQKLELRKIVRTMLKQKSKDKSLALRCPECPSELKKRATLIYHYLNFHYAKRYVCCICKATLPWHKFDRHLCDDTVEMNAKTNARVDDTTQAPKTLALSPILDTLSLSSVSPLLDQSHCARRNQSPALSLSVQEEHKKNAVAYADALPSQTASAALPIQAQSAFNPGALELALFATLQTLRSALPLASHMQSQQCGFLPLQDTALKTALCNTLDESDSL